MRSFKADEMIKDQNDSKLDYAEKISEIRNFWDEFVYDDVKASSSTVGSNDFYAELEAIRKERLDYLPRIIDFSSYKGKRVLDVGCRIGLDLARFAEKGAIVTGIDLAPTSIETAREYFKLKDLQGEFIIMNGEELQFEDQSFDLVYAHGVIQYTVNPKRMISEMHRVLRTGGELVLMAYNRFSWLTVLSKLSGKYLAHEEAPFFKAYSIKQFYQLLNNFDHTEISPVRFPSKTLLHKGLVAKLYYTFFVGAFEFLPISWVEPFGAHLIAKAMR